MRKSEKVDLIRKHLGVETPDWVISNCMAMLKEFEVELDIKVEVHECRYSRTASLSSLRVCLDCGKMEAHTCVYSKAMNQEQPRKCITCGEGEKIKLTGEGLMNAITNFKLPGYGIEAAIKPATISNKVRSHSCYYGGNDKCVMCGKAQEEV